MHDIAPISAVVHGDVLDPNSASINAAKDLFTGTAQCSQKTSCREKNDNGPK
jgi:hypothetical protein